MKPYDLGLIGAGNMAEAILRAAVTRGVVPAERLIASDPSPERLAVLASLGITGTHDNGEVIAGADVVLLAVKPQALPTLADALRQLKTDEQVVISIMAGLTSSRIEAVIGRPARIVRVMPNTPLMVGRGMSGVSLGPHARPGDEALAMRLFGACGEAVRLPESDLDAVTAVSGSGPAYLFYLAEAMQAAAERLGLSEHARLLVRQTLLGSAELLHQSDDTPAELRRKVTSPGGTTEAAVRHLDKKQVSDAIVEALHAARDRSVELGSW